MTVSYRWEQLRSIMPAVSGAATRWPWRCSSSVRARSWWAAARAGRAAARRCSRAARPHPPPTSSTWTPIRRWHISLYILRHYSSIHGGVITVRFGRFRNNPEVRAGGCVELILGITLMVECGGILGVHAPKFQVEVQSFHRWTVQKGGWEIIKSQVVMFPLSFWPTL